MSLAKRLFLVVLAVLVVLGLGYWLSPVLVNDLARELWALPEQAWTIGEQREREYDLNARRELILRLFRAKEQVLAEVIGGRLSLVEAARRFRDHYRACPLFDKEVIREAISRADDEEHYCQAVLDWVRIRMKDSPDQAREVLPRLEAELAEVLARRLPSGPG